jgi:hypothetical protein
MDNLRRPGNQIFVGFPTDEKGFTGRHCPNPDCNSYFKVVFGTGLAGDNLPCHCPYCGHSASHLEFMTGDQLEYAKSVAFREFYEAFYKELKKLEFNQKPRGSFGIGVSMKVERPRVPAIKHYQEEELETEVLCSNCSLRYAIYGAFAYCPDCASHNTLEILEQNFSLLEIQLALAEREGGELGRQLIEDSLENAVAAFDAFGREVCAAFIKKNPSQNILTGISFQNLESARRKVLAAVNVDMSTFLQGNEWQGLLNSFQKRHVFSHRLGVVDQEYIDRTGDTALPVGRKLQISPPEVRAAVTLLEKLGSGLHNILK